MADMNTVIFKRLETEHQSSFREFRPLSSRMAAELSSKITDIFDALGGRSLLKSSGEVYIKPNVVGPTAYVYTRPEAVEAAACASCTRRHH